MNSSHSLYEAVKLSVIILTLKKLLKKLQPVNSPLKCVLTIQTKILGFCEYFSNYKL